MRERKKKRRTYDKMEREREGNSEKKKRKFERQSKIEKRIWKEERLEIM